MPQIVIFLLMFRYLRGAVDRPESKGKRYVIPTKVYQVVVLTSPKTWKIYTSFAFLVSDI